MRFLHPDVETGSAFEHGHFRKSRAPHPERDRESLRLKSGEFQLRFTVESRRLAGTAGSEGNPALDNAPAVELTVQAVVRQEAGTRGFRHLGQAVFLPCGKQLLRFFLRESSLMLGDALLD